MSADAPTDLRWLDAAARFATPSLGSSGPSSTVGAVLVDPVRQVVVGRAVTPFRGAGQAEMLALADAGEQAAGATLYVTFEPAAHYTSFAPATERLIGSGIGRVVIGDLDPDRELAGQGLRALAEAGLEAVYLPHAPSQQLNEGYASRVGRGRPHVTLKITVTAGGMVGHARAGEPNPLGLEALRWLDRERAAADAVLAGAARTEIENNDLRVHLAGLEERAALRVLLVGSRDPDLDGDLFRVVSGVPILMVTTPDRTPVLRPGIEVVTVEGRRGHPDLRQVLAHLAGRGINRLLVEAGARLAESFIAGELVDRLHVIEAAADVGRVGVPASLLGGFEERIAASRFSQVDRRALGEDKVRTFQRL